MYHHDARFADRFLPPWLDVWPAALRPAREAVLAALGVVTARLPPPPLDSSLTVALHGVGTAAAGALLPSTPALARMATSSRIALHAYAQLTVFGSTLGALTHGGNAHLSAMATRLALDGSMELVELLRAAVTSAPAEADGARAAASALLSRLFPRARAIVVRLAPHSACSQPQRIVVYARHTPRRDHESDDDDDDDDEGGDSSRAFVLSQEHCTIADSRDFPEGNLSFPDWARSASRGDAAAITALLPAGPARLGTLMVHFPRRSEAGASPVPVSQLVPHGYAVLLMRCCRAIGEALFARREAASSSATSAVASDIFPQYVVERLVQRNMRMSSTGGCSRLSGGSDGRASGSDAARLSVAGRPSRSISLDGGSRSFVQPPPLLPPHADEE